MLCLVFKKMLELSHVVRPTHVLLLASSAIKCPEDWTRFQETGKADLTFTFSNLYCAFEYMGWGGCFCLLSLRCAKIKEEVSLEKNYGGQILKVHDSQI